MFRSFSLSCLSLIVFMAFTHLFSVESIMADSTRIKESDEIEETINNKLQDVENEDESLAGFEETDDESLEGFEEADDDSFDEIAIESEAIESSDAEASFLILGGFFKEEIAYSHEREEPEISKIRSTLNLNFDFDFSAGWKAGINLNGFYDYVYEYLGREEFTDETLETYESEYEVRDIYVDGRLFGSVFLKIGRQIIAWGESESVQITDMANPRDLRELGMVDIEDARIPVLATKLTVLISGWESNFVAIHEVRSNKIPAAGSEFDLLGSLRAQGIIIEEEDKPENSSENTEYLFRVFKPFNGGDISLIWADVFDDSFYLDFWELSFLTNPPVVSLIPRYKRIKVLGASGNLVSGSWLFKTELAGKSGVAIARNDIREQVIQSNAAILAASQPIPGVFDEKSDIIQSWTEKNIQQLMVGAEYSGIEDFTISLEISGRQIEDYEENLLEKEVAAQMALGVTHTTLNDTLNTRLFVIRFADDNGVVVRLNVDYDIIDALNISAGVVAYEASKEEAVVYAYRLNDRVFTAVKFSF